MKFIEIDDTIINIERVCFISLDEVEESEDELTIFFDGGQKLRTRSKKSEVYDGESAESVTYAYLRNQLCYEKHEDEIPPEEVNEAEMVPLEEEKSVQAKKNTSVFLRKEAVGLICIGAAMFFLIMRICL